MSQQTDKKQRPFTVSRRKMALSLRTQRRDPELESLVAELGKFKPKTRGECRGQFDFCPWVSCRYHLYIDVSRNGSIKFNFPDLEVWELPYTCALDVADMGEERKLSEVGSLINLTRERIRQCVDAALSKLSDKRELRVISQEA